MLAFFGRKGVLLWLARPPASAPQFRVSGQALVKSFIVFMKTLACGEGSQEEGNNGTTVPLKKAPFRAFSSHPFNGWLLT